MAINNSSAKRVNPLIQSVSFSGSAWFFTYNFGIGKCLQDNFDLSHVHFLGASSGSLVAAALSMKADAEKCYHLALEMSREVAHRRLLGPVGKMSSIVSRALHQFMEPQSYKIAGARLKISVTTLPRFRNLLLPLTLPASNSEIIQLIMGSCYIPIYAETPIFWNGVPLIDGGITDNLPVLNERTICATPWSNYPDKRRTPHIFPKTELGGLSDVYFPRVETMTRSFAKGYEDCEKFINLLKSGDAPAVFYKPRDQA